jgi:enoyl-CoA hydratase/carnithine racemase
MLEVAEREYFPLLHELADESALISLSPDAVEGMKAFVEKRPPAWRV